MQEELGRGRMKEGEDLVSELGDGVEGRIGAAGEEKEMMKKDEQTTKDGPGRG